MKLPTRALTDVDIKLYADNIPNFRGVFMRDRLPKTPLSVECGVINLDSHENPGTHWVAYIKNNNYVEYFDSYGNLRPPLEFIEYINCRINYNYDRFQFKPYNCGHLCLKFLKKYWDKNQ